MVSGSSEIIVTVRDDATLLSNGKKISYLEALYLLNKGKATFLTEGGDKLSFKEAVLLLEKRGVLDWDKFSVYVDLRERGRISTEGPFKEALEIVTDNLNSDLIFIVQDARPVGASRLVEWSEFSKRNNRNMHLAVIDKYGDVTYYNVERISFK